MARGESGKLATRSLTRRPAETILLVIGIALGIGTTAGGISMVAHLRAEGNALVESTAYREIVVSTREDADDMETAAYINESAETVMLTGADLVARDSAPDIEYAYTVSRRRTRISNFDVNRGFAMEGGPPPATPTDGEARPFDPRNFVAEMPSYEEVAPVLEEIVTIQTTPEFFLAYGIEPAQGSLFTQREIDDQSRVIVVGAELAGQLFEDGIAMNREILIGRNLYEIIGVAEPTGTAYDEAAFYPSYATGGSGALFAAMAMRFGGGTNLSFTVASADRLDEAKAQLESYFDSEYGSGAVVVSTPGTEARAAIDRNAKLVTIILFLAITGLLIAAVNVSNILYSRAMRKRKSIGILKALGATRKAVFSLFLEEALTIGVIGTILGVGVSIVFTRLLGDTYASDSIIGLPMIAGAVGAFLITFGLTIIPALQASSIPAAEALRYE